MVWFKGILIPLLGGLKWAQLKISTGCCVTDAVYCAGHTSDQMCPGLKADETNTKAQTIAAISS